MYPPRLAIISENTLEAAGLKSIIDAIIPMAEVDIFNTVDQLAYEHAITPYFHFFVSSKLLIDNTDFFLENARKTIVLTTRSNNDALFRHFHTLNPNLSQRAMIKEVLMLHQSGHSDQRHPHLMHEKHRTPFTEISNREKEVLALVARGFINKEIAEKLNISLPTVITHRKNICEKLNMKSVSALTIYAVTHGLVKIDEI